MRSIEDIGDISGKRVLVRADFNVPVKDGVVVNDYRITQALPSFKYLKQKGAILILISHIENEEDDSLKPIVDSLSKNNFTVNFLPQTNFEELKTIITNADSGTCFLLENIRRFEGEKKNDEEFAKSLASLGDIYVNEAFPVSHREHASIVGVPKLLPSFAGLLLQKEVKALSEAFHPSHPFLFILGGAKFETKEPLITKFLDVADDVFVGGALGNDFFKAKGLDVGGSITSGKIPEMDLVNNPKLMIPADVVVRASDDRHVVRKPEEIMRQEIVSDAGPETLEILQKKIMDARLVLWNGPLGFYEKGFDGATKEVARMIAKSRARSIVGGGDTVAAIESLGIADRLSFISTGGGAMLEFLAKGSLPGVDALDNSAV